MKPPSPTQKSHSAPAILIGAVVGFLCAMALLSLIDTTPANRAVLGGVLGALGVGLGAQIARLAVAPSGPAEIQESSSALPGDSAFYAGMAVLGGFYVLIIVAMLAADFAFAFGKSGEVIESLLTKEIRYATKLSLISASISAMLSLWVAIPLGYLLARKDFVGKSLVDAILDIPIFLPPLVVGLSLLILFRQTPLRALDDAWGISMYIPAVILSQFVVAAAFAARTLRATFEELSPRCEQVAMTLGCTRYRAFWLVVLPEARAGILTAGTMAWARALGEFGPLMIFAGSTRMKTEVLPISVYLEFSIGNIEGAVGVSLLMVIVALSVLMIVRSAGSTKLLRKSKG